MWCPWNNVCFSIKEFLKKKETIHIKKCNIANDNFLMKKKYKMFFGNITLLYENILFCILQYSDKIKN